jgi:GWxTD domain-containing protein
MTMPIKMIDATRMMLSDLELASSVRQGAKGSAFYKNTLEVIPNVDGVFSEDQQCHFYVEAYNLLSDSGGGEYYVRTGVFDAIGREVISRERPKKRLSESSVIIDNLAVKQLRSGTYTLVVGLVDSSRKVVSQSGKKFFVYNPTLGVDSTLLHAGTLAGSISDYAGVAEVDLDNEFAWAVHESNDVEETQYKQLKGEDSKRKFLSDFWQRRPLGLKEEYLKRVGHANASFRILGRAGFKTDRGRVYITYGPPDDYDRHPNDSNSRPYEVWSYNAIQGGVIFVFVQRSSGGDYELVHSTHRNELHDENWARYALTN